MKESNGKHVGPSLDPFFPTTLTRTAELFIEPVLEDILHSAFSLGMIFSVQSSPWTEKLNGINRDSMEMC